MEPSLPRLAVQTRLSAHPHCSLPQFLDEPLPTVHHWTSQQVGRWLHSLNLEQYADEFAARQVDGPQLLQLDGSKLRVSLSRQGLGSRGTSLWTFGSSLIFFFFF